MPATICISAKTLDYPDGGGHRWVYLNWALGLRALGCRVIWLEVAGAGTPADDVRQGLAALKGQLAPYGLADDIALGSPGGEPLRDRLAEGCLDLDAAAEADLLLNFRYDLADQVLRRFRRTVLVDIDPGLLQVWLSEGHLRAAGHDLYFTIGETVGTPGSRFPDLGVRWHYTPPCVSLDWWPAVAAPDDAPFTTVSHWSAAIEWVVHGGESYANDKRTGFLPFLDLPRMTTQPLELALCLKEDGEGRLVPYDEEERRSLVARGWRVRLAREVSSTPWDYQAYLQSSRGEFSGAKPSCVRLQNAWISDRTIGYLASGKPAVVRHTGPSGFLPDSDGLFRFRDVDEAARHLEAAASDYDRHCRSARALAEEFFDARRVLRRVLERAL